MVEVSVAGDEFVGANILGGLVARAIAGVEVNNRGRVFVAKDDSFDCSGSQSQEDEGGRQLHGGRFGWLVIDEWVCGSEQLVSIGTLRLKRCVDELAPIDEANRL